MRYKLPDNLWTWAWRSSFLAQGEETRSDGGIILPSRKPDDRDAIAHFSRLDDSGDEQSWLWLFPDKSQAVALRMAADYVGDPQMSAISQALPRGPSDQVQPCTVLNVPLEWIRSAIPDDIHEVWIGFDWRGYSRDFALRAATDAILSAQEFRSIAGR